MSHNILFWQFLMQNYMRHNIWDYTDCEILNIMLTLRIIEYSYLDPILEASKHTVTAMLKSVRKSQTSMGIDLIF